ncbi:MAG: MFS transporter, partial [Planctomycetes bacterium]|nr:MFS transporter [Planctomycetota bacterium]
MPDDSHDQPAGRPSPRDAPPNGIGEVPVEPEAPFRPFRLPSTFASLRHRNFRIFFVGRIISLTGSWMQMAALSWLIYDLTGSKRALGIIGAIRMAPMMVFSLLGGVVADRYPKRKVILITQTMLMALALLLAGLVFFEVVAVWQIVALGMLTGCVLAFDIPARQSFVVELVDTEDMSNAIALNSTTFNLARILGPALAGILMAKVGMTACFLINGLSFLALIVSLLMMRLARRTASNDDGAKTAFKQMTEGFSIIAQRPALRGVLILVAVTVVFGLSYGVIMPVFAKDVLGLAEDGYGLLLSANGAGALVGALVVASLARSRHKPWIIVGGVMLFSTMLFLFASAGTVWPAALCLAGVGVGFMLFMSTSNALLQTGVPDEVRGRVMGMWSFV